MDDLISRQAAIDALEANRFPGAPYVDTGIKIAIRLINELPSVQPEQTEMIKEIRKWINSGNRGNADYFIVDKIEEILNKYE